MNAASKHPIAMSLTAGAVLVSAVAVIFFIFVEHRLINVPLHSTVEVFGSFAAITLGIIIILQKNAKSMFQSVWVSCGLLSMGILDIFHGMTAPGNLFVWLRSIAAMAGGIFFSLVWLGQRTKFKKTLAYGASAAAILIGILSVLFQEALPAMIKEGAFTQTAWDMNIVAGILYIASTPAFLKSYFDKSGNRDDLIIFSISLLFGFAGLLFHFSEPWSTSWWYWHSLRLVALITVLAYALVFFKNAEDKYKTIIQTTMEGFWVVDSKGHFLDVNDSYCKLTGYTREELLKMQISDIEANETPEGTAQHILWTIEHGADRFETKHRSKDGTILDFEVSANYLEDQFFVFLRNITERKRTEEVLKTLSNAVEQIPASVLIADVSGTIKYVNPQFSHTTGYSREEIIREKTSILKSDEHPPEFYEAMWNTIISGATWRGDVCIRKKNGEHLWELQSITPIRNAKDEIINLVFVTIEDIERRRAEKALIKNEARYHMVHSTAFDGIILAGSDGKITECNTSAEKIFGYGKGELVGKDIICIIPEHLRQRHLSSFRRFIEIGQSNIQNKIIEIEGLRSNGEVFPVELVITSFVLNGEVTFNGTIRDITERKRFEAALKKSQANLAEAQRIAGLGNWEWDIINNTIAWSEEIYRIFGKNPEEFQVTYETFLSTIHPDDRDFVMESVNEALQGAKTYNIDHRILLPDGTERIVHEQAVVTFSSDGKPAKMFGTVQDVTEYQKLQAELLKAQKLESVGVLAGGIAHDFNNILTAILVNLFLTKKSLSPNDQAYERITNTEKSLERAKELTCRLLTFSKGGMPVKQVTSVVNLIRYFTDYALSGSNIRCEYIIPEDLWPVEIDERQINQVIRNLVINAVQAMPDGGAIEVGCKNIALENDNEVAPLKAGEYVMIYVKDHGSGIKKEHLAKIFDPYFTTKQTGSGLGLAASYSIIKNHNGLIAVDSEEGAGATFTVYLPAPNIVKNTSYIA
ncbi:MAG: PAS domain S-box protein [Deltaproteobacteria bacterium]|nr:PAS domain S-box protein [Deltaproteobacteria bacterium]